MVSSQCRAQRSPYRGLASKRSTTRSYAPGFLSPTNALISASVGGRPIRSNVTRRMRVRRSVAGPIASPFADSFASRKRSRTCGAFPAGTAGLRSGCSDQCVSPDGVSAPASGHDGPDWTQLRSIATCAPVRGVLPLRFGGITKSTFVVDTR